MTGTEFYWTVVVALSGACWTIITTIRERRTQAIAQSHTIIERLIEGDRLIIGHPDIQQYLSKTALEDESFFRKPDVLTDEMFFKAKSYLYYQLNLFDEILSTAAQSKVGNQFLRTPQIIEISDWEAYMVHRLTHPLCLSIMRNEGHIFGCALQKFWETNKSVIVGSTPDRFSW